MTNSVFISILLISRYILYNELSLIHICGGCRASNYIAFIRRALKKAGMEQIPVISVNLSGLESNPGFKLTLPLVKKVAYGAVFGDILMKCVYRMRPYELEEGIRCV